MLLSAHTMKNPLRSGKGKWQEKRLVGKALAELKTDPVHVAEGAFRFLAFDLTTANGLHPARALLIIVVLRASRSISSRSFRSGQKGRARYIGSGRADHTTVHYCNRDACRGCELKPQCTANTYRRVARSRFRTPKAPPTCLSAYSISGRPISRTFSAS
jgi:hypothetical protein